MQVAEEHHARERLEVEPDIDRFEQLGIDANEGAAWRAAGVGPFEAALAHGDGITPSTIVHYRHQLQRIASAWVREGLDSADGLEWHRAGFAAKEAAGWRAAGIDLERARARRSGYGTETGSSKSRTS
jgi:hypothetical protein